MNCSQGETKGLALPKDFAVLAVPAAVLAVPAADLDETPEAVASTNATLTENAAHLARLLRTSPYP